MGSISINREDPVPLAPGGDLLGALLDGGRQPMYLCMAGSCGRCRATITAGLDLLEPPNDAEVHRGCTGPDRLLCQARLERDGEVAVTQG